jgi:hypothetical protein
MTDYLPVLSCMKVVEKKKSVLAEAMKEQRKEQMMSGS